MISETVQAAQGLLAQRERVGLAKYGTTVDRTDLQAGDWLQHAIEEASDLLLYLIRLQQTMPRAPSEDADRAAYLKRWENAPEWADWACETMDGACAWSEKRPSEFAGDGWWVGTGRTAEAPSGLLGRYCCEPRPEVGA